MNSFGEKVIELRRINNMTQSELGSRLNVSAQAVSKWENNQSEPDMQTLKKMCNIFNVSLNELLSYDETGVTNTDSLKDETSAQPRIIVGYCSQCKKPIEQDEDYEVFNGRGRQFIYCKDCKREREIKRVQEDKKDATSQIRKGFIWGTIASIAVFAIFLACALGSANVGRDIVLTIVLTICSFAMVTQVFWDGAIVDVFDFFCRSFSMPGVIFSLDLDGIIWFIAVKLLLSILAMLLSVFVFLIGLVVALVVAPFTFVPATTRVFREKRESTEQLQQLNDIEE